MANETKIELPRDAHLGDGCYISCDGYHFWLAVNHHQNKVVAMEPGVVINLAEYLFKHSAQFQYTVRQLVKNAPD